MRIAKFKIAVGTLLGVLAIASSLVFWNLSDTVVDKTSKRAHVRWHEIHKAERDDVIQKTIHVA